MKPSAIDFQPYLRAIAHLYSQQNALYTPTDALLLLEARSVEQQDTQRSQERQVEQFPVLTGLRKYALGEDREHVLLAGRPGSGKSTALKQLAIALAEEGQVPVLVQLKGDRTVPELIQAEFRRAKQRVTLEQIEDWLLADQLILLLDGVNEIPNDDLRRGLAQFREDNLTVPMIFTTRELAVGGDFGIGKRLEMKPLSESQMREFVKKYLPEHGEQLLRQLRDRLREIAETPLFLKMLCDVFKQTREIPQNKGELFRQFDRNYERLKKDYVPVSKNFWEFKSEVLQHLAFSMIQADGQKPTDLWLTISKHRAESLLENWLHQRGVVDAPTKAKEWLKDLCNHHLLQDAAKLGEIEFHHQLFQEYYAAEYLLQKLPALLEDENKFKRDYLNYLKWTEAIALMLALVEEEALALRVVKLAIDTDLRLGARLSGEIQPKLQKQPIGWIEKMVLPESLKVKLLGSTKSIEAMPSLLEAIQDPDFSARWDAATALGRVNGQESIRALLRASKDPVPFVRLASIAALGTIGNNAAIEALLKVLGNATYDDFYLRSAYELGKLGNEIGIQKLREALDYQESSVIHKAISALKLLNTKSSNSVLLEALLHSKNYVRKLAVQALGENGNDAWIPNLLEVLEHEDSRLPEIVSLDESVIYALGKIGRDKAITALLSITEHQNPLVRRKVLEMFGILRCKTAVSTLQEALKDKNITIREIAATSLGQIGDELAVPDLLQALDNNSHSNHVREAIAEALGQIGSRDAVPNLLKMLMDEDSTIRWKASDALGKIASEEVIVDLLELLKHPAFQTQQIAARTLGLIGNKAAIPGLIESLEEQEKLIESRIFEITDNEADISEITEESEELREVIVVYLAVALVRLKCCLGALVLTQKLKHLTPYGIMRHYFSSDLFEDLEIEAAIPALLDNLDHHITNIRYAAASVLDNILRKTKSFSETLLPAVRKSLKNSDEFVYISVISVLRKIDDKEAVVEILESLDHPHLYIQLKIASALAELGNKSVIPVLLEALHNEDILIRKDAAFALGELGSEAVVDALLRLLDNREFKAQKEILEALGKIGNSKALPILQRIEKIESTFLKDGVAEAIATIQNRCKYYNHEIYQSALENEETGRGEREETKPIVQMIFNAPVHGVAGNVEGNQNIGTEDPKAE
jgi:HEAT repeat protein/energy-coupling factor transporter ATP-binding protein EcfA2